LRFFCTVRGEVMTATGFQPLGHLQVGDRMIIDKGEEYAKYLMKRK